MRVMLLTSCLLLLGATGCSKFAGEWIEEGTIGRDGTFHAATNERRMALAFYPPATVRYGSYLVPAGVVEEQTVQEDTYFVMQNMSVAQTGGMTFRPRGKNHLISYVGDAEPRRFARVRGKSVFPPPAILPSLAEAEDATPAEIEPEIAIGG